ncbi:MAG: hypothetical protein K2J39_05590 [Ruminococcus sp.]|nr:hypothetical protein [Ruminococcus sp.]
MILKKSRLLSIVTCIITVLSVLSLMIPKGTYANSDKSMTLVCVSGDTILSGMDWKIYRVGQRSADGQRFVQNEDFSGTQINLRRITADSINKAAQSYQSYAVAAKIPPIQEGFTNEQGEVQFTGLSAGLYLICGKTLQVGSNYYVPNATLIEVREEDTDVKYDAYPKFEYQVMNGQPRAHTVYKEWEGDDEHLDMRPDHVEVEIYKDEVLYETVTLSAANNWRYRWVDSTGASSWLVMEKDIPECYQMIIDYDNNYRIQNSYDETFTTTTTTTQAITTTTTTTRRPVTTTTTTTTRRTVTTTTTTLRTSISLGQASTTAFTTTTFPLGNLTVTRTRTTTATFPVMNGSVTRPTTTTTTESGTVTTDTVQSEIVTETTSGETVTTTVTDSNTTTTQTASGSETVTTTQTTSGTETATTTTTEEEEETPATTRKTTSASIGKVSNSGGGSSSNSVKLPQTGQLWWPVVPLSIGGILFISAGLVMKSKRKSDD